MGLAIAAPYTLVHQFSVKLAQEQVHIVTKPGLPAWNLVSPSTQLFIENARIKPGSTVLLYGCHLGPLAVHLARFLSQVQLYITDHNHTSLEMTRLTLEANDVHLFNIISSIKLPRELDQWFDVIYIQLPKGRQLARRWLVQAYHALHVEGSLYLAGANNAGIQSVITDARGLFGNGNVLAYKKGNRVAHFIKTSGDGPKSGWTQLPGIAPDTWIEFPVILPNQKINIRSLPGVFSSEGLDEGTEMLLRSANIPTGISVLDVGCGYGIIGLHALAKGAGSVHLVDNDLLAIAACNETLAFNSITNAQVYAGDLLKPVSSQKYDLILSNPPFHSERAVDYQIAEAMIGQSYQALLHGGMLTIVANRFIRDDRLIDSIFGNVSVQAESVKYHVLSGLKSR